jgi:hypothetical protein
MSLHHHHQKKVSPHKLMSVGGTLLFSLLMLSLCFDMMMVEAWDDDDVSVSIVAWKAKASECKTNFILARLKN